ncbi:hypothetical protein N9Z92_03090 [Akkermansiaceae bacterium]|nr:hypothetical protein [Akkermansiaceae bacterium]MDB4572871.1 hypothetical protein [Akkermansiaceae bacterium]
MIDGDVIDYTLNEQQFFSGFSPNNPGPRTSEYPPAYFFFPDRPGQSWDISIKKPTSLSERLCGFELSRGRDFSRIEILRRGENEVKRISLDIMAASRLLKQGEEGEAKALALLKIEILPGDIIVCPPRKDLAWKHRSQDSEYAKFSEDPEIEALFKLAKPPKPATQKLSTRPPSRTRSVPSPGSRSGVPLPSPPR